MKNVEDKLFELFIIQLQILRSKTAIIALYNYYDYTFTTDLSNFDAVKFVRISEKIIENQCNLFTEIDCDKLFEYFLHTQYVNTVCTTPDYKLSRAIETSKITINEFMLGETKQLKYKIMKSIIDDDVNDFYDNIRDARFYGEGLVFEDGEYKWRQ